MNEDCLLRLIGLLYHSVIEEGGDGDALWYCTIEKLDVIMDLVTQYNSQLGGYWSIERKPNDIFWSEGQQAIHITDNKETFDNAPSWITLKVQY